MDGKQFVRGTIALTTLLFGAASACGGGSEDLGGTGGSVSVPFDTGGPGTCPNTLIPVNAAFCSSVTTGTSCDDARDRPLESCNVLIGKPDEWMGWSVLGFGATAVYPALVYRVEPFDLSQLGAIYLGLFLLIGAMVMIGVFISSLTQTQLIAAMSSYGAVLLLWNLSWNEAAVPSSMIGVVSQLCAYDHFEPFSRGVIDLKDVAYFLSLTLFAGFLTMRSMESRQWRGRR